MGGDGNTQTMNHPSDFITLSDHEQFFPRKFQHPNMLIFISKQLRPEKAKVYNLLWPTVSGLKQMKNVDNNKICTYYTII